MQVSQGNSLAPAEDDVIVPRRARLVEDYPVSAGVEMVQGPGKSLAPAEGEHEPSPSVGGMSWGEERSQSPAASDYGTFFDVSHGTIDVPTGSLQGQPLYFASAAMQNSQSEYAYRPTLTVALRDPMLFLSRRGNPRIADPGPESQGPMYPPPTGLPLGQRGPRIVPPSAAGQFKGETVTKKVARRFLGPRKMKPLGEMTKGSPRFMIRRKPKG